jgi:hypothetical protein
MCIFCQRSKFFCILHVVDLSIRFPLILTDILNCVHHHDYVRNSVRADNRPTSTIAVNSFITHRIFLTHFVERFLQMNALLDSSHFSQYYFTSTIIMMQHDEMQVFNLSSHLSKIYTMQILTTAKQY